MNLFKVAQALGKNIFLSFDYLIRSRQPYKSMVEKYPDIISAKAPLDMFPNYRGYVRNDLKKCTGCGDCVPICPVKALNFKTENKPDGGVNVQEYSIDLGKCFNCGLCLEVCPESSLFYSKDFELVSEKTEDLVMVLHADALRETRDITRIRTYEVRR